MPPTPASSSRQSRWGLIVVLVLTGAAVALLWPRKWLPLNPETPQKDSREAKYADPAGEPAKDSKEAADAAKPKPVEKSKPEESSPPSSPPADPTSKAAPPEPPPWQQALDDKNPPPDFAQLAFARFEESFTVAGPSELAKWFEPAPGANLRIGELTTNYGKCGTLEGLGRLKCPWPEDGVLRLQLENFNRLQMHFYHGDEGATFIYYEDQSYRWAAYATTRDPGQATPQSWAITATDDDRARRTDFRFGGPLELRYRDHEIVLSRGDIVLLAAPLAGPPSEVFFEGRATFDGIALVRATGMPWRTPANPIAQEIARPADLAWKRDEESLAKPELLPDGSVRLAATGDARAECFVDLPCMTPSEIILQLADVSPGTGVYLGRDEGQSHEVLRFFRESKSGRLAARMGKVSDKNTAKLDGPAEQAVPLLQPNCWVKLLFGCGNVRWWLSTDGERWAETDFAVNNAPGNVRSIGLFVAPGPDAAQLALKRIALRPLAGLSALADAQLVERAPALVGATSLANWREQMLAALPDGIDSAEWLRAGTLRTLARGAESELAYPLLEALLDDASQRHLPLAQQLAALNDAALLCHDLRDRHAMHTGILSRYLDAGIQAADREGAAAWSSVRRHFQAVSVHTPLVGTVDLERPQRWELIAAAYQANAADTQKLVRPLKFFTQARERPLVDWAASLAESDSAAGALAERPARRRDSWRELLIEDLSKETFTAMTDLEAVVESQSWEDAARLVTAFDPEATPGIAPYVNDADLLTSLPVAVRLVQEQFPKLRLALHDQFAPLGQLRVSEAIAKGDAARLELATVQFAGTPAAADAFRWLGDRALVSGWFAHAISQYRHAGTIQPALAGELAPRIRLAAAMLGEDAESPVTSAVTFNEVSLSPTEFESLIAEMRGRATASGFNRTDVAESERKVPPPSSFDTQVRARLDGPSGERPQEETGKRTNQFRVPWVDRQIAVSQDDQALYVSNRFHVASFNLASGERNWTSQTPQGPMQRAQDWTAIPMRPLVTGDQIFVRMLYGPQPQLVCLEKATGKLLWAAQNRDREFVASDPLLIQGQLIALLVSLTSDQAILRWCIFDPQTGEPIRQRELLRLRSHWQARACCEVAPLEDGLIAVLSGITVAVSAGGDVRWIRKHLTVPGDEDPRWILQHYQPPLIAGERMFVAQPGVRTIDCLSVATGSRHWSAILPEGVSLVGLAGETLIVRTESDVRGLNSADGTVRWRYPAENAFPFQLASEDSALVATREPAGKDQWQVRLTWLDAATGQAVGTTSLPALQGKDPRLGPIVVAPNRLFLVAGRGLHDPNRDLVELVPRGKAEGPPLTQDAWEKLTAGAKRN